MCLFFKSLFPSPVPSSTTSKKLHSHSDPLYRSSGSSRERIIKNFSLLKNSYNFALYYMHFRILILTRLNAKLLPSREVIILCYIRYIEFICISV